MAFKLCEAFVEFSARTAQATQGMKQIEQQAEQTATQMDTQMTAAGASVSAFGAGLAAVGVFAATKFAVGMAEGIKAGGSFADTLDAGASSLLGVESHLQRMVEGAKVGKEVMDALTKAIEEADAALDDATKDRKPMFPAFGKVESAKLENQLNKLGTARNKAFEAATGPQTEIDALKRSIKEREAGPLAGNAIERALIESDKTKLASLEKANHKVIDAAHAADMVYRARLEDFTEANRKLSVANFLGSTGLGLAKDARDVGLSAVSSARADFAAARDGIGPLGFLGKGAAGIEAMINEGLKSKKELEDLQTRQGAGDARFAGVQAIGDRFKKQIEEVEKDIEAQRKIEHSDPVRKNREAADAKITADKELIDQLREQEADEKRRFQNTAEFATGLKKSWDNIAKIATKTFGWGP